MNNSPTSTDPLEQLRLNIDDFARQRDWEQFHTPKNLSMALTVEAAELMEIFQWAKSDASLDLVNSKREAVEHEVADIFIYLLRLCSVTGIDLLAAAESKLKLNAEKYPAQLVKGRSDKYTDY